MTRRALARSVLSAALTCALLVSTAPAAERPMAEHFPRTEPGDLIRRAGPAGLGKTRLADGLALERSARWDAKLGMLLLDATLVNTAPSARQADTVTLADWTFARAGADQPVRYQRLRYSPATWYGSTFWTGPDWTRVGKNWHHPGINTPSVRCFVAPADGRVAITGRVFKMDATKGDGIRASILHGAQRKVLWQAEIGGTDAKGVEHKLALDVRKGEPIRFVVHKRGRIFYDTTGWDPTIAYELGPAFQASKGFSTKQQGAGGWFYEMEVDPDAAKAGSGLPTVHSFARAGLAWTPQTIITGKPVDLGSAEMLPILVLADGHDCSGVALALAGHGRWPARVRLAREADGSLRVTVAAGDARFPCRARPGEHVPLPRIALAAYRGAWPEGFAALDSLVGRTFPEGGVSNTGLQFNLEYQIATAPGLGPVGGPRSTALPSLPPPPRRTSLALRALVQQDWLRSDYLTPASTPADFIAAAARHLPKAAKLAAELRTDPADEPREADARKLARLAAGPPAASATAAEARAHYLYVRRLVRRVALSNPLLDFDRLLLCKRVPTSYSHLVMQYFGWRARPGGGLFVLDRPGYGYRTRDILGGRLADGNVLEPRLSYDGKRIVFSFVPCREGGYNPGLILNDKDEGFYHLYQVNTDGTGLRQITSGPYDDLMPTWLPDGGIAFCSTRRRGHARCFGGQFSRRWHVYTLFRVEPDGTEMRELSFHDTNEWFPTVGADGRVLYARWDYIDRDAVTHQNLWATRPDGTNPVTVWGNATPSPHCSFQARAIPGTRKIVVTASAHHSVTAGSIVVIDPAVAVDGHDALTRITPEVPFPEAESRNIREYYSAPWPLADPADGRGAGKFFLVAYSPYPLVWEPGANRPDALGVYLLDAFGNRELIHRDLAIGSTNPCPLRPRPSPPVLPSYLPVTPPPTGEMTLLDVYRGLGTIPRGTVKQLRIVQILPKTTHLANNPPIGLAGEENARAILGTVPVEADGSARFTAPARKLLLFQALDADGLAVQTMRTVTYLQPGEKVSCVGCHEPRRTGPPPRRALALRRAPSPIDPGPLGGRPFSFVEVVQPVLDKHCTRCHAPGAVVQGKQPPKRIILTSQPDRGYTKSYWSLCGDQSFSGGRTNPRTAAAALVPRFGARNPVQVTPPGGVYGSPGSRLIKMLRKGHSGVKLTPAELRRLAAWIDMNAIFYGVYDATQQARQLRGEAVPMPAVQ